MKTGLFIALLNPAIALVLASAFLVLWLYQRHRPHLAVLAFAYAASAVGFLLQYFTLPAGQDVSKLISSMSFMLAVLGIATAIVARFGAKIPYVALGGLGAGGLAAFCWFMFVTPDLTARICAINFAFAGISLIVAAELRAIPDKGPAGRMLLALSLLAGLNFLGRTLLLVVVHGGYETYEGFYDSHYWTTTLLSHALLSLLIAFALISAAALDILGELRSDSRTDPLSGLLNRRGFEERAAEMLQRSNAAKPPMALVLADLDHFKSVNDRFGHAAGDQVIAAFAEHLRTAAGEAGIVGRLGGEEFAVLLPACDLTAARLFAEGVRSSFSQGGTRGLAVGMRVTASFGVAANEEDSLSTLLARADEALYQAKKNGRDSVHIFHRHQDTLTSSVVRRSA